MKFILTFLFVIQIHAQQNEYDIPDYTNTTTNYTNTTNVTNTTTIPATTTTSTTTEQPQPTTTTPYIITTMWRPPRKKYTEAPFNNITNSTPVCDGYFDNRTCIVCLAGMCHDFTYQTRQEIKTIMSIAIVLCVIGTVSLIVYFYLIKPNIDNNTGLPVTWTESDSDEDEFVETISLMSHNRKEEQKKYLFKKRKREVELESMTNSSYSSSEDEN